mgnify:CR=1 FL=1
MKNTEKTMDKIVALCKNRGFVFPGSEIYGGLANTWDYGPLGVELKNNIKQYWWNAMTRLNENIVGIDSCVFMHPKTWVASGHVAAFNDPLIDNKDSKKRYRADNLIEDYLGKIEEKMNKEVEKGRKRFGEAFDEEQFRATNPNILREKAKYDEVHNRYVAAEQANDLKEYKQIILDCDIVDPISGTKNWTDVRQFNLMFRTEMGSTSDGAMTVYLRPETAQGIFVNYLNVQKTGRMRIPPQAALRCVSGGQGLPQRDCRSPIHLPYARIRADGDAILCTSRRGNQVVRAMEKMASGLAQSPRHGR